MTNNQMATIINNALIPNRTNENATMLAEDLSNYVDVGTSIASMTADTLKDFQRMLAVGVRTMAVFGDVYSPETFNIKKSTEQWGNALQRVAMKNMPTIQDSHALQLVNGTNYLDGKYYGADYDSKVYTETYSYKASYSWSDDQWAKAVTDASAMNELLSLWLNSVQTQINLTEKGKVDMILNKKIVDAVNNNKKVDLVTAYNTEFGASETYITLKADEAKMRRFTEFCTGVTQIIKRGMMEFTSKYNDGSIKCYTPQSRLNSIYLTQFVNDLKNYGITTMYHAEGQGVGHDYDKLSWQSSGTAMLPLYTTTSLIKDGVSGSEVDYDNIVGIIYDDDGLGLTTKFNKITTEYVGSEGFTTYHHHVSTDQYIDGRGNAVVLTLD